MGPTGASSRRSIGALVVGAAALTGLAACHGTSGTDARAPRTVADRSGCPTAYRVQTGGHVAAGLNSSGSVVPTWSGRIGDVSGAARSTIFATEGACVVAVNPATGRLIWRSPQADNQVFGPLVAGAGVVVAPVETGSGIPRQRAQPTATAGNGPTGGGAMEFSAVSGIRVINETTGRPLWHFTVVDDSQANPTTVSDGTVVLARTDNSILGFDALTGQRRWTSAAPSGCRPGPVFAVGQPPTMLATARSVVIGYDCADHTSEVIARRSTTGAPLWTWRPPAHTDVDLQVGNAAADGVATVAFQNATAAEFTQLVSTRHRWPFMDASGNAGLEVGIDEATGTLRWLVSGVPIEHGTVGDDNRLCLGSEAGIDCLDAVSGRPVWQWRPIVTSRDGASLAFQGDGGTGIVAAGHRLYVAAPTSRTPPHAGVPAPGQTFLDYFELTALNLGDGTVAATTVLPSYNGGQRGVGISAESPPGVLAVSDGQAILTPQLSESSLTEAIPLRAKCRAG